MELGKRKLTQNKNDSCNVDESSSEIIINIVDWDDSNKLHKVQYNKPNVINEYPSASELGIKSYNSYAPYLDDKGDNLKITNTNVVGVYSNKLDIFRIHQRILKNFRNSKNNVSEIQDKIRKINKKLMSGTLDKMQIFHYLKVKKKLEEDIVDAETNSSLNKYLIESSPIISEYNKLHLEKEEVDFFDSTETNCNKHIIAQNLIDNYITVASKYIDVNITKEMEKSSLCSCGYDFVDLVPEMDGILRCPECGIEMDYVDSFSISMKEFKSKKSSRNNYEDRQNFIKALTNYQGKQENKLPTDIYDRLDEYFGSRGMLVGPDIRSKPINKYGKKDGTSLSIMLSALRKIGLSDHYEDANLIMSKYWGWILPDLSHLEEKIMDDYDKSQSAFLQVKSKARKSCLNAQYRLYRLLQRRGFECDPHDFKIVVTDNTFRLHEKYWEKICQILDCEEDRWIYKSIV